jgi:hypothetical protein
MFRVRPAGPAADIAQDDHSASESRSKAAARGIRAAALSGSSLLARAVRFVAVTVVLIIATGILLALLKANATNSVVSEVHGWGRWLVGPFNGMFSFHTTRVTIAVNWGIAAVIYLFAGGLIARFVSRSQHSSTSHQEDS